MLVALTLAAYHCEPSTDQCSSACLVTLSEPVFRLCSACFHTTPLYSSLTILPSVFFVLYLCNFSISNTCKCLSAAFLSSD